MVDACGLGPGRRRVRSLVLCALAGLFGIGLVSLRVSLTPRVGAADCRRTESCPRPVPKTAVRHRRTLPRSRSTHVPDATVPISAPAVTSRPIRALVVPTGCAAVVDGVVWPPAWRVQCLGP